jgi:hypothetical protein
MIRCFLVVASLIAILMTGNIPPCEAAQDAIEQLNTGTVNWTRGMIKAKGLCISEKLASKKPINCERALANAKINAHHNLLEAAKAVRVENGTTIGEFAGKNDIIMAKLMDMVKQAPVIEQKYSTDGTAEVTVQMTMFGGLSQLVLPIEIEHVEDIKPVGSNHKNPPTPANTAESVAKSKKEIYSGLIVDARGLNIHPVMTPKILDENRQEVYGPAFVSRELAVQKGLCHYETDIRAARSHEKMATNPLTVKGLRYDAPYKTDIIISNADALKLKSASEHLKFLKKCQVIIVMDPKNCPPDHS